MKDRRTGTGVGQQAGLVKLGHVALDGTKVKANASKHRAMSYQRMKEKAAQLAAEVAELQYAASNVVPLSASRSIFGVRTRGCP